MITGHGRGGQDQREVRRDPGNDQGNIAAGGNVYLDKNYPGLTSIKTATIVQ